MGSYGSVTGPNVAGTSNYIELVRFTNLPIGVYILSGSTFINSIPAIAALQFGTNATTQNTGLSNIMTVNTPNAGIFLTTQLWFQTSVQNIYFSGNGNTANFQFVQAYYVRIA